MVKVTFVSHPVPPDQYVQLSPVQPVDAQLCAKRIEVKPREESVPSDIKQVKKQMLKTVRPRLQQHVSRGKN